MSSAPGSQPPRRRTSPSRPARTSTSKTYPGLPPGSACTVTETANGAITGVVDVATTIAQPPAIEAHGSVEANVTDTYTLVTGPLVVTKNIAGAAAGSQGAVTIRVVCPGVPVSSTPAFVISAGSPAGPTSHTYDGIPIGTKCLVFETADGRTSTVSVAVTPGHVQKAPPVVADVNAPATVTITDTYTLLPGSLLVGKGLLGPAAGLQGPITITATCGGTALPSFVIPAGTPAGLQQHFYDNIPGNSSCTVTETADGTTSTVVVTVIGGSTHTATVLPATVTPVRFTDLFTHSPGVLAVTKNITGTAAGTQGSIAILVDCGQSTSQFAILIPANTPAGAISRSFNNIPAGSTCTVTELSNGASSAVPVTTTGSGQQVTVLSAATATATVTNEVGGPAAPATVEPESLEDTEVAPGTLPATGAGAATLRLLDGALAAIAVGGVMAAAGGRRRRLNRKGRQVQD